MDKTVEAIKKIASGYPSIKQVVLFGSRARRDCYPTSDYDICVVGASLNVFAQFRLDIDEIPTVYKVDIARYEDIESELFVEEIKRDGVIIYEGTRSPA